MQQQVTIKCKHCNNQITYWIDEDVNLGLAVDGKINYGTLSLCKKCKKPTLESAKSILKLKKQQEKEKILKILQDKFKKYKTKKIKIKDNEYKLFVIPQLCDDDLNVFDGIIITDCKYKKDLNNILRYKPCVTGYNARLGIIIYKDNVYIKDFRKKEKEKVISINELREKDIDKIIKGL